MTAGWPDGEVPVPAVVARISGGRPVAPVWRNELGGITFRIADPGDVHYLKWQPLAGLDAARARDVDLAAEAEKLMWARRYMPVPEVLEHGRDADIAYLVTRGIDAEPALSPRWRADPATAVRAIAAGLRRLHDTLPADDCPWHGSWPECDPSELPEPDRLVVCHGDACVPNTLIDEDGRFAAHVDLARLGVADRWADLAIASYSIGWDINFGPGFEDLFFETYGVARDVERIDAYRRLWDAPSEAHGPDRP